MIRVSDRAAPQSIDEIVKAAMRQRLRAEPCGQPAGAVMIAAAAMKDVRTQVISS
jgi:hypothetical protein